MDCVFQWSVQLMFAEFFFFVPDNYLDDFTFFFLLLNLFLLFSHNQQNGVTENCEIPISYIH